MFCEALGKIKDDDTFIRGLLQSVYDKYTDGIIIHCEKDNKLVYFEKDQLKELQCFIDSIYYLKHAANTCSAQIMRRTPAGEEINTCLRIRLVLNNGVNALVGQSTKNKTSVPCIKIQQDNVDYFINTLNEKIEEKIEASSETPASETPASETTASETTASETTASETTASETTASETPASETPASETPTLDILSEVAAEEAIAIQVLSERFTISKAP
jgi:ribosomal protein L12E/L44/L45/RPP1/RPP2